MNILLRMPEIAPDFFAAARILCLCSTAALALQSCESPPPEPRPEFVSLEGKQFRVNGEDFYPVTVNYIVDFVTTDGGFALSPTYTYEKPRAYEYRNRDSLLLQFDAHMKLIRNMGFNSIRLCIDRIEADEKGIYYHKDHYTGAVHIADHTEEILDAFASFVDLAAKHDLRIMPLIRAPHLAQGLPQFTEALLKRFANNPAVFAYDFFNEPLYFDKDNNDKAQAVKIAESWRKMMRKHAPHQLMCIGFSEPTEVFRWDPSLIPADFIAFHTYHPLRIQNEIYWYSKFIDKPWMIGETSLPADNDSISYEEQRQFALEVVRHVKACGGSGFAWWEFQDEPAVGRYDAAYNGLLNNTGETAVQGADHVITGTLKPAADQLKEALATETSAPCTCAVNYTNMLGYRNFLLEGSVQDEATGEGIEGAVIRGWSEHWDIAMNTFTDENGRFTLYSNEPCVHFEISAPGRNLLKFDQSHDYTASLKDAPAKEHLTNRDLEYHDISYQPFLRADSIPTEITSDPFIFDFDPEKFDKAHYRADAGTFHLKPWNQ